MTKNKKNNIKKTSCDFITLDDLLDSLCDSCEENGITFEDIVNLDAAANDRELIITDVVENLGVSVASIINFWNRKDEKDGIEISKRIPIKILIDSNGGSLTDAFTIINAIELSKTPVQTIVTGKAYSAGFFIAITGHQRFAYPYASFLYHEGSAANGGTASQFRNFAEFYEKQLDLLKSHVLKYTTIDEEQYTKIKKDDVWMLATDALEIHAIDAIIPPLHNGKQPEEDHDWEIK